MKEKLLRSEEILSTQVIEKRSLKKREPARNGADTFSSFRILHRLCIWCIYDKGAYNVISCTSI